MEFIKDFQKKKNAAMQQEESNKLRQKHPDRVPILVDRCHKEDPMLDKNKYLVPTDLTMGQFLSVIRKRLTSGKASKKLDPSEALFFFTDNMLLPNSELISKVFKDHSKNGYLVITYSLEKTFGSADQ